MNYQWLTTILKKSWYQFHQQHKGLITTRPVESRNQLNRTCLTMWISLKKTTLHEWSKKQLRNQVTDIHKSGKGYKTISKALNSSESHYSQMDKTAVNLPRSGQEVTKEPRTTLKNCRHHLAQLQVVFTIQQYETDWRKMTSMREI